MPHVASQMWAGQLERPDVGHRRAVTLSAKSLDFQRPPTTPPRRPRKMSNAESVPSLSLLMPENQPWDFGSIRHIRQPSYGTPPFTPRTPFSSVDSIFDLPSGVSAASSDTPISSTQSSFVAELEDTSQGLVPKPLSPRRKSQPTAASYIKELQSPAFSKLAAIAIENIRAIETDNQILLERAIAAEEATKLLKEKNDSLQHRIEYCKHEHRPRTAPGKSPRVVSSPPPTSSFNITTKEMERTFQTPNQTPTRSPRRPRPAILNIKTPCSSPSPIVDAASSGRFPDIPKLPHHFDLPPSPIIDVPSSPLSDTPEMVQITNVDRYPALQRSPKSPQTPTPTGKRRRRPSPLAFSQPLTSPTLRHDLAPSSFATVAFPANPHPYHRTRPSLPRSFSTSQLTEIGSPIPGSVVRHEVTYAGTPLSNSPAPRISLAEARRKEKPLPPNGPMSPSTIPGRVEIGSSSRDWEKNDFIGGKKKKGICVLFRWCKKDFVY